MMGRDYHIAEIIYFAIQLPHVIPPVGIQEPENGENQNPNPSRQQKTPMNLMNPMNPTLTDWGAHLHRNKSAKPTVLGRNTHHLEETATARAHAGDPMACTVKMRGNSQKQPKTAKNGHFGPFLAPKRPKMGIFPL